MIEPDTDTIHGGVKQRESGGALMSDAVPYEMRISEELVPVVHRTCAAADEFVLGIPTVQVLTVMQDYVWTNNAVSMIFTLCLGPRIENLNIVSFFSLSDAK